MHWPLKTSRTLARHQSAHAVIVVVASVIWMASVTLAQQTSGPTTATPTDAPVTLTPTAALSSSPIAAPTALPTTGTTVPAVGDVPCMNCNNSSPSAWHEKFPWGYPWDQPVYVVPMLVVSIAIPAESDYPGTVAAGDIIFTYNDTQFLV